MIQPVWSILVLSGPLQSSLVLQTLLQIESFFTSWFPRPGSELINFLLSVQSHSLVCSVSARSKSRHATAVWLPAIATSLTPASVGLAGWCLPKTLFSFSSSAAAWERKSSKSPAPPVPFIPPAHLFSLSSFCLPPSLSAFLLAHPTLVLAPLLLPDHPPDSLQPSGLAFITASRADKRISHLRLLQSCRVRSARIRRGGLGAKESVSKVSHTKTRTLTHTGTVAVCADTRRMEERGRCPWIHFFPIREQHQSEATPTPPYQLSIFQCWMCVCVK